MRCVSTDSDDHAHTTDRSPKLEANLVAHRDASPQKAYTQPHGPFVSHSSRRVFTKAALGNPVVVGKLEIGSIRITQPMTSTTTVALIGSR